MSRGRCTATPEIRKFVVERFRRNGNRVKGLKSDLGGVGGDNDRETAVRWMRHCIYYALQV
jgi:hypothetical protein